LYQTVFSESIHKNAGKSDRYRHINQFIDAFETEGEKGKDVKERICRKDARIF
jgi:hypothetical protein